jgi:autotransporter translocation and assembly factor TamB
MHVTGLATHLNLDFSSEPAYSREQILGLLVNAQALGAVSGVASTGSTSGNGVSLTGIGGGFLADQFTQRFLQPFSSKLGSALGLSSLDVNYGTNGAVSATARRRIGKNVSFVYGQQFGGAIQRTSVGINVGTAIAGAQLTFYQTIGSQSITAGLTPFLQSGFLNAQPTNYTLLSIEPPAGSGFVFSYQRKYW